MPGEDFDFDEALGFDDSESTGSLNFRWRYTKNWSLWGQYWAVDSKGGSVLKEDIEWEDQTFLGGSFASAEAKTTIARVFFGRSFLNDSPGKEFGLGAGLHWMEIDAFIEGQILAVPGPGTELRREKATAGVPLPNLGAWYLYSWSPKWAVLASIDWLRVSSGEVSGGLTSGVVGIKYQVSDTFGLGLSYNSFKFDVDVEESDFGGRFETGQAGPRVTLTAAW